MAMAVVSPRFVLVLGLVVGAPVRVAEAQDSTRAGGQVLEPVRVVDTRPPSLVANGFYDRQRKTGGRFLDSLALRGYASTGLVGVLRETRRVGIQQHGTDDYAYGSVSGRRCRMNVFVDGVFDRASQPGIEERKFRMQGVGLRELIPFSAILAIEIYPTVSSVPRQFQRVGLATNNGLRGAGQIPSPSREAPPPSTESSNAECGAIVIWTKRVESATEQ